MRNAVRRRTSFHSWVGKQHKQHQTRKAAKARQPLIAVVIAIRVKIDGAWPAQSLGLILFTIGGGKLSFAAAAAHENDPQDDAHRPRRGQQVPEEFLVEGVQIGGSSRIRNYRNRLYFTIA
jgi:hypothetical protein